MPTANDISSFELTPTQDFSYLREKGLEYVQQLSGKLWTDHNLHDPGITILEVLCYALMDLGYRSNFSMADMITEKDGTAATDAFHTAAEIFTTKPVSISDYRKLLVDIVGVRNAWLFTQNQQQQPFDEGIHLYAYCKDSVLLHESEIDTKITNINDRAHVRNDERVFIEGIYAVKLELEEHPLYGDLNSNIVNIKIINGALAGYELEIKFPDWNKADANNKELFTMFNAPTITALKVELINDTSMDLAKFILLQRAVWKTKWTIKYGIEERILTNVKVKVVKTPPAKKGLAKGDTLQAALSGADGMEALKRYRARPVIIFKTFAKVRQRLMANRNLSEDFLYNLDTIDTEDLSICVDIDVATTADLERIQAEVFSAVENYLLPPVQFSTLKDLLNADVPLEAIFDGPKLDHGFLTDEAINKSKLRSFYYTSDIISLLMDIPGVLNVRNFQFTVYQNGDVPVAQPDNFKIIVSENHKLRLGREKCKILFFKNGLPLNANFAESVNKLRLIQTLQNHLKYKKPDNDLPIPTGKYRSLDKHYTILNEFPRVYGLGEKDLPENVSPQRKAQVQQLEAYLTFFDQLIANYCSQLQNIKNLLSWKKDVKATYLTQYFNHYKNDKLLFNDVEFLITNKGLQQLMESEAVFMDRRNRLLDHLIARFAESFNDYAINMYALPDEMVMTDDAVSEKLIGDKITLLKEYPKLSSSRGTGYDYSKTDTDPLASGNVSGYAKRVRSLLGMEINNSKPLSNLADTDFGGFHLIEHLMLRPSKDADPLLSVCLDGNCDHCGDEDPYSFKVSIVLPFWLKRFENMHFRNYMESLFRSEAPAHIFLKICWVDKMEMAAFETAYAAWVIAKANYYAALPKPSHAKQTAYTDAIKNLIEKLEMLRTDFPIATLHDCVDKDETNDTRVFLGNTFLGEFKPTSFEDPE